MGARSASVAEIHTRVVERVRSRRRELHDAILARIRDGAFGSVGDEDAEYLAGLRDTVAAAVEYALDGIAAPQEDLPPIPPLAVAQARRAARLGVSLETVLRRYLVGHTVLEDFAMQEVDAVELAPSSGAIRMMLRAQAALLHHFTATVARTYADERERAARSPEHRRAERVQRALAGAPIDTSDLNYDLDGWHLALIATGPGGQEILKGLATALDQRLLVVSPGRESAWAWLGGRHRLAAVEIQRLLSNAASTGVTLAVGEPGQGPAGWRSTHRQAQAALDVALRAPRPVTCYADVALLALALRDELARSLVEIFLSPLDDQRDGGVAARATLRAYLACGRNASSAAAALRVARHTVENRLRAIEDALGRPLATCIPELAVALRLEELASSKAPSSPEPTFTG